MLGQHWVLPGMPTNVLNKQKMFEITFFFQEITLYVKLLKSFWSGIQTCVKINKNPGLLLDHNAAAVLDTL